MPNKPLVAIVDDDESIRDTTKDLLESAGLAAATFASGPLFLKSQRLKTVSCLVADVRMPGMTGLELQQHLIASNQAIPTILMTAYPDERVRAQALKSMVVCYLAKPFEADELLACVRSAIQRQAVPGRLEERMTEREQTAGDRPDTLLQAVQRLLRRFNVAAERIPLLDEGRATGNGLRAPGSGVPRLPQTLAQIVAQLAPEDASPFHVTVEGAVRELDPVVHEQLQLIACEALTNAYRHANASRIEAEIAYANDGLTVRVRDDGQGIDEAVLLEGRSRRFGFLGMRESARKTNARLTIWSKPGAGTEVEIRVPAAIAYHQSAGHARRKSWWRKAAAVDAEDAAL